MLSGTMYVLPYVLNKYCIYMLKSLNLMYAFKETFDVHIKKNKTFISKVIKTDSFKDRIRNDARLVGVSIFSCLVLQPLIAHHKPEIRTVIF